MCPNRVGKNLMIIEDDASMRELLFDVFRDQGFNISSFSEGATALGSLAQNDDVDAVICDLNMPKMSGMIFLENAMKLDPTLPVILITAFGTDRTAREAYRKGAFGYLAKPFPLNEIGAWVQKALNSRSQDAG